ncbi:hypothetical protein HK100_002341 [Physocladia obscura]|uniref:non-specific serine/threonine protein kinase n=1 Tax=Physocladia obscura TaxID=109957 RepID=A0AAD5SXN1_9FUNG|nr:hypothetical protein HK100_002341 [Physocladia obscura]
MASAQISTLGITLSGESPVPRRPSSKPGVDSNRGELLSNRPFSRLSRDQAGPRVGPYLLGKTLGVGSTGRVKLGTHIETNQKVAIKIIPKESLIRQSSSDSIDSQGSGKQNKLNEKTEREITIMKLIQHPNVMQLYDVYETEKELYLILEHIECGELFDYLVSQGRLPEEEALDFFQQIVFGVDYCHRHMICHRDLKPENLLLNKSLTVKVADFGMASMQVSGKMLETSCGSPHYASPEIIKGEKYNGALADVWSCGVILYALLTGNLPFDDENIRKLLSKVKAGTFKIPDYISGDAKDLIRKMLVVDPSERINMSQVFEHPWFRMQNPKNPESHAYLSHDLTNPVEPQSNELLPQKFKPLIAGFNDPDCLDLEVVSSLGFLGWNGNEKGLIQALLCSEKTMEKVFYNLLCQKKWDSFENYVPEEPLPPSWDKRDRSISSAKRRVGSISISSLPGAQENRESLVSRINIYKSELDLFRQSSNSSIESLVQNFSKEIEDVLELPIYVDESASPKIRNPSVKYEPNGSIQTLKSPLSKSLNIITDNETGNLVVLQKEGNSSIVENTEIDSQKFENVSISNIKTQNRTRKQSNKKCKRKKFDPKKQV